MCTKKRLLPGDRAGGRVLQTSYCLLCPCLKLCSAAAKKKRSRDAFVLQQANHAVTLKGCIFT